MSFFENSTYFWDFGYFLCNISDYFSKTPKNVKNHEKTRFWENKILQKRIILCFSSKNGVFGDLVDFWRNGANWRIRRQEQHQLTLVATDHVGKFANYIPPSL
jgi:hypothetical protein